MSVTCRGERGKWEEGRRERGGSEGEEKGSREGGGSEGEEKGSREEGKEGRGRK